MITVRIIRFKSKKYKDGTSPIMLVFTRKRKRQYLALGYKCTEEEWNDDLSLFSSKFPRSRKRNELLMKYLARAEDIIEDYVARGQGFDFSFEDFKEQFIGTKQVRVFDFFETIIQELKDSGNIGNSDAYKDARNALRKYDPNPDLGFRNIDYNYLKQYELAFKKRGVSGNSISVHMRTIRALFNKAIKRKLVKRDHYPFEEYKISTLETETQKRAISLEAIKKIENYNPTPFTKEKLSQDLFLFSFYMMGMNFNDIAKLKWTDVQEGRIIYKRSKTKKHFSIKIFPRIQKILDYWKKENKRNPYIFPILDKSYNTPVKIKNRIESGIKRLNMHLKKIGRECEIKQPLTSYVARHSWATIMKKRKVSGSIISEALGHASEETTRIYLDSFGNEILDQTNELLMQDLNSVDKNET